MGPTLPEEWQRAVSLRRLLVIVRHLPATSAVRRATGDDFDRTQDLLDEIRRGVWSLLNRADMPMHPDRPAARRRAADAADRAVRRHDKAEASRRREAERQARIRARQQGGDP